MPGTCGRRSRTSSRATTYTWNFGDGQSAATEDAQHTFGSNGTYTVQLIASSICNTDTFSIQVEVNSLGLSEVDFNPVTIKTGEEFVELTVSESEFEVNIFDVRGKIIGKKELSNGNPVIIRRIDRVQIVHLTDSKGFSKVVRVF